MSHEPFDTLAAGYAVGALDGEDQVRFEAHLAAGCAECEAIVRESREALLLLARDLPPATPPAHVKEALERRIAATREAPPRASGAPVRWRWLVGSAVAAVAVAGFTAGFVAARYEARLGAMAREMAAANDRWRTAQAELGADRELIALLSDPATRVVPLHGQPASPDALGRLLWNDRAGGQLFVAKLPPAPEGKTYELWTIGAGGPRPAGLLGVPASGTARLRVEPVPGGEPVKVFAVTLEPEGGRPTPTGPMVLASK